MVMEQFLPQEFIAVCWHVETGSCYSTLYHDVTTALGLFNTPDNTYNPTQADRENMYYGAPHGSGTHRLPDDGWFKDDGPQAIANDGHFYTSYASWTFAYSGQVNSSTPLYMVEYNNKKHYFSDYKPDGNHS